MIEKDLSVALEAARLASEMIWKEYQDFVPIADAPIDISTEVDKNSQELIIQYLRAHFPIDQFCAEETTPSYTAASGAMNRIWVIDPIDGTRGFAMKNGEFSVMIGLIADGEMRLGVVAEPAFHRTTYAAKGQGCWVIADQSQAKLCQVTTTDQLANATLIQSHYKPSTINRVRELIQPKHSIYTYSAGVKLAYVARGEADLYVNDYANFHDWDICAGHFLVLEAGGLVTEFHGDPIEYLRREFVQDGGLVASNGKIHSDAIQRLTSIQLG